MTEEIQTQNEQKNTVATVWMRFSIIWLIAFISIILTWLWIPLLIIWFILWIVGLFYKPKKKARVAVSIPLIVFAVLVVIGCYIWSSVKTPAKERYERAEPVFEQLSNDENFDNDRFSNIGNEEINKILSSMSEEEFTSLIENSTWSNIIEKWSYVMFWLLQQVIENSIEKYNNELPEVDENNTTDNEAIENEEENNDELDESTEQEITIESNKNENSETFSQNEKNDIEQIINILE